MERKSPTRSSKVCGAILFRIPVTFFFSFWMWSMPADGAILSAFHACSALLSFTSAPLVRWMTTGPRGMFMGPPGPPGPPEDRAWAQRLVRRIPWDRPGCRGWAAEAPWSWQPSRE